MTRSFSLITTTLALLLALGSTAEAQLRPRRQRALSEERAQETLDLLGAEHVIRDAWKTTGKYFFSRPILKKRDWKGALERALKRGRDLQRVDEVHAVINAMLAELKVSHLGLLERDVYHRELAGEFANRKTVKAGCELMEIEGKLYVAGVSTASPAAKAGLKDGDEVLSLNGEPAAKSALLVDGGHDPGLPGHPSFCLRIKKGEPVTFRVRRRAEGPVKSYVLTPEPFSLIESAREAVRTEQVGKANVGVIELRHFIHRELYRIARTALTGELAEADALVLDVRGRGGSSRVVQAILSLFSGSRAVWKKPVVLLTDDHTRSAKEIFAYRWKQLKIGPIVGERTQGAVIGCQFFEISDGSILCLPIRDVRFLLGGVDLEGVGVDPTIRVKQLPLPYRAGGDSILAAGLRQAAKLSGKTKRKAEAF